MHCSRGTATTNELSLSIEPILCEMRDCNSIMYMLMRCVRLDTETQRQIQAVHSVSSTFTAFPPAFTL